MLRLFCFVRFRLYAFVEAAALCSIVLRYAGAPIATRFFSLFSFFFFPFVYLEMLSLFPSIFRTIFAFSLNGEYVVHSFLSDGVFLARDHGLEFLDQLILYGVTHTARVWINWVRLPILHVVSCTGKSNISLSAFAPENFVSRDGFGRPVPRQPAHLHTQVESGAYLRDSSRVPRRRPFIYFKPPYAIESVPTLSGHGIAYRWRSLPLVRRHGASKSQGSSERLLPW